MLYQLQNQIFGASPTHKDEPDPDTHGHSPRQRGMASVTLQSRMTMPHISYPDYGMSPVRLHGPQLGDPYWSPIPQAHDVFMEDAAYLPFRRRGATSSSGDQSMPDYPPSLSPGSSRAHSNHQDSLNLVNDLYNTAANAELHDSPNRPVGSGTIPPANTRVNSANNTPSHRSKPSAAAEARASSYSHTQARSVPVTTRDPPPQQAREPSDMSMRSRLSETQVEGNEHIEPKIKKKPAKDVKGRKEGKSNELGLIPEIQKKLSAEILSHQNKENFHGSAEKPVLLSDSKRKRSANELSKASRAASGANVIFSPSRKASKTENVRDQDLDDLTPDGVVTRRPLADMGSLF